MCLLPWPSQVTSSPFLPPLGAWSFWHLLVGVGWLDLCQFSEAELSSTEVMQEQNLVIKVPTRISDFIPHWLAEAKLLKCDECHWASEDPGNGRAQETLERSTQLVRFWATVSCILLTYKYQYCAMPSPFAFPASLPTMRAERAVAFRLDVCNHHDLVWELHLEGRENHVH